jgi:hypothetical protein
MHRGFRRRVIKGIEGANIKREMAYAAVVALRSGYTIKLYSMI